MKNLRVLFITSEFFNKTGGGTLTRSYYSALCKATGKENALLFAFPTRGIPEEKEYGANIHGKQYSMVEKAFNVLKNGDPLIGNDVVKELLECIEANKIDSVFLFRSTQAKLLKKIKKKFNIKSVVFFHDIFPDAMKCKWKDNKISYLKRLPLYIRYAISENYASKTADRTIVMNERDYNRYLYYYKKKPTNVLPMIVKDSFCDNCEYLIRNKKIDEQYQITFVGSNFWANTNGLKWFVNNVMPLIKVDYILRIVGYKMELLKNDPDFNKDKIEIVGTVDDLKPYYYDSDLIVMPILEGTGMKTKTAEALQFGKTIVATPEALCGYKGLEANCCRTAKEFAELVEYYYENRPEKFSQYYRSIYLDNYSESAVSIRLKDIFNGL